MTHDHTNDRGIDDTPFPPLAVTRAYAYALSVAFMMSLFLWWGPENMSDDLQDRYELSSLLFLGSLVPGWLAYSWTRQGHYDHATGAFVLSVGAVTASLLIAYV